MDRDILTVLKLLHPAFQRAARIAKYILENYEKAAFMTASRLGQVVVVSESRLYVCG